MAIRLITGNLERSPVFEGPALLRVLVGALVAASMVHMAVLVPRYVSISRAVPPGFQTVAWAILVTVVTAVGACALALVVALRSWARPGAHSLALFLAFLSRGMAPGTEGSRLVSRRGKVAEGGKRSKWAPLPPPHPSSTRLATFLQIQTRNEPRRPALPGGLYERVTTHWVNR